MSANQALPYTVSKSNTCSNFPITFLVTHEGGIKITSYGHTKNPRVGPWNVHCINIYGNEQFSERACSLNKQSRLKAAGKKKKKQKTTQHKEINLFMAAQHARFLFLPLCCICFFLCGLLFRPVLALNIIHYIT